MRCVRTSAIASLLCLSSHPVFAAENACIAQARKTATQGFENVLAASQNAQVRSKPILAQLRCIERAIQSRDPALLRIAEEAARDLIAAADDQKPSKLCENLSRRLAPLDQNPLREMLPAYRQVQRIQKSSLLADSPEAKRLLIALATPEVQCVGADAFGGGGLLPSLGAKLGLDYCHETVGGRRLVRTRAAVSGGAGFGFNMGALARFEHDTFWDNSSVIKFRNTGVTLSGAFGFGPALGEDTGSRFRTSDAFGAAFGAGFLAMTDFEASADLVLGKDPTALLKTYENAKRSYQDRVCNEALYRAELSNSLTKPILEKALREDAARSRSAGVVR